MDWTQKLVQSQKNFQLDWTNFLLNWTNFNVNHIFCFKTVLELQVTSFYYVILKKRVFYYTMSHDMCTKTTLMSSNLHVKNECFNLNVGSIHKYFELNPSIEDCAHCSVLYSNGPPRHVILYCYTHPSPSQ